MDLSFKIHSSNLKDLISIYNDSMKIRESKEKEFNEEYLENRKDDTFKNLSLYKNNFNWILLHSLFISSFSYFENFMRSAAKFAEKENNSKIKISDINGKNNIDKYRKYLNLICKIENAENQSNNWIKLMGFNSVRNCIIHEYGIVKKPIKIMSEYNIYFGPSCNMIRMRNIDFLVDFVEIAINYMDKINEEYKTKTSQN